MGKLLLILLAVFAAFLVVSLVISALHFLFVVALVALVVVGVLRLTGSARRRRARWYVAGLASGGQPGAGTTGRRRQPGSQAVR